MDQISVVIVSVACGAAAGTVAAYYYVRFLLHKALEHIERMDHAERLEQDSSIPRQPTMDYRKF